MHGGGAATCCGKPATAASVVSTIAEQVKHAAERTHFLRTESAARRMKCMLRPSQSRLLNDINSRKMYQNNSATEANNASAAATCCPMR